MGLGINPLLTFGTQEQKERWLPDLVAGQALAGFGLTEPGAGSDASATKTKADLDGDEWVVNGAKQFITNSGSEITSLVTVTARTGTRENGSPELSTIVLPSGTPGFIVEPAYDKLGWHISDTHPLSFVDARVPADHLLGERGRGYAQFLATLDDGRVAIAALAVGCIQAVLRPVRPVRRRTYDVRRADRHQAGGRVPDLRSRRDGAGRARADVPSGCAQGRRRTRQGVQAGRRDRQALHLGVGRHRDAHRDAGVRRLRLHGGVLESPGSTATPRSSRSARVRPRCSAC